MAAPLLNIYVTGGSSTQSFTADQAPLAGMGQALGMFFNERVNVINHAITDRSSKSFIEEGRLQTIERVIEEGDYLFIHFGHNDMRNTACHTDPQTTFKQYLTQFVEVARKHEAIPVLVTPVCKREFAGDGKINNVIAGYADAVRQLGDTLLVDVIDLNASSKALFEQWGAEWTQRLFLWLALMRGIKKHFVNRAQGETLLEFDCAHDQTDCIMSRSRMQSRVQR